ncbi:hypothetical protein MR626_03780 [bacterium]|nr:hypothetical protein [bacterium]
MCAKLQKYWKSLDRNLIVNQRELLLGLTVCALAGVLTGILVSPRKHMTIGSYNGNGTFLPMEEEPEDAAEAEGE